MYELMNFCFLICKMGITWYLPHTVVGRIEWNHNMANSLAWLLSTYKFTVTVLEVTYYHQFIKAKLMSGQSNP